MFVLLLTLLILDALLLSAVVLLQAGQGGGLASLGGGTTDTVLGGRQAVTILTKLTWWCGGIFLLLALILSFVPRAGDSASQIQERLRATTPAEPPASAPLPFGTTAQPPGEGQAPEGAPRLPVRGLPCYPPPVEVQVIQSRHRSCRRIECRSRGRRSKRSSPSTPSRTATRVPLRSRSRS